MSEFLSPEGALFLRLPPGWQWEQDSEDGHYLFQSPRLRGTVRVAEAVHEGVSVTLEGLMRDLPGSFKSVPVHLALNGIPAVRLDRLHENPDGRRMRMREWIASDGRAVVYLTHEVPEGVGDAEDDEVDQLVHSLELRSSPHPVIATLLVRLNRDRARWAWRQSDPLYVYCPETGESLSVEPLVRSMDVDPAGWSGALEDLVRKINNLDAFAHGVPPFERVASGLLPLIRGEVIRETRAAASVDGAQLLRLPWAPGLYVYYAVDVPGAFQFVPAECGPQWGRDVHGQACANLAARALRSAPSEAGALMVLEDGEGLAASRLLLSRFRRLLADRLGDPFCVALPSAGVLIAFSRTAETWKETLGEDVWEAYLSEPVPISRSIYELDTGGTPAIAELFTTSAG